MDADTGLEQFERFGDGGAAVERAAEVAGVLVEQAVRDEHDLPAARVG